MSLKEKRLGTKKMYAKCGSTYRDFELSVVEEKSSVSAYELIFLGLVKRSNFNLSHFSYLIIL